jgi:hypothetical protein
VDDSFFRVGSSKVVTDLLTAKSATSRSMTRDVE